MGSGLTGVGMPAPMLMAELARAGRRKRTYGLRAAAAGAVLLCVLLGSWTFAVRGADTLEFVRSAIFFPVFAIQLMAAFLVGPYLAIECVMAEKEERTLELLLLADIRGYDIILAKFAKAYLEAGLLVVSTLPVLAVNSFLGGVSLRLMAELFTIMLIAAACMTALGLLGGAWARSQGTAAAITGVLAVAWLMGPQWAARYVPGAEAVALGDWIQRVIDEAAPAFAWWQAGLFALGLGLAAVGASRWRLARWQADPPPRHHAPRVPAPRPRHTDSAVSETAALAALLGAVTRSPQRIAWPVLVLGSFAMAGVAGMLSMASCFGLMLALSLPTFAVHNTIQRFQTRAVQDDIGTLPVTDTDLAKALLRMLLLRGLFFLPAVLVLFGTYPVVTFVQMVARPEPSGSLRMWLILEYAAWAVCIVLAGLLVWVQYRVLIAHAAAESLKPKATWTAPIGTAFALAVLTSIIGFACAVASAYLGPVFGVALLTAQLALFWSLYWDCSRRIRTRLTILRGAMGS